MRVYELAKELGLSSKDVMSTLKTSGVTVSSHMSVLSDQDIARVRVISKPVATQEQASFANQDSSSKKKSIKTSSAKKVSISPKKQVAVISSANRSHQPNINLPSKKVDMTDSVKMTSPASEVVVGSSFKKHVVSHEVTTKHALYDNEDSKSFEPSGANIIADDVRMADSAIQFLDEQRKEKLGIVAAMINTKGQDKFTRIFADAKRRPTGGRRRRRVFKYTKLEHIAPPVIITELNITGPMRVSDVAIALGKPLSDVILNLLKRGMAYNINNVIQPDIIRTIAEHYGITAIVSMRQVATRDEKNAGQSVSQLKKSSVGGMHRRPVVVVMGHVDHGKTTLLDYIRKKNVAASEKGGITQHLGAYEVESKHGGIIFLDTPGHEAFSYIRKQGSKVTDIAILVIAADDGIKPQTIEAIKHAQAAEVAIIVAINKIDKIKSQTAFDTIKRQLSQYNLMTEDLGGQVICVPVSAKTGEGVDHLLEMIILQAQIMELKARVDVPAKVFILESRIEKGFGPVATGIVIEGILKQGDLFSCGGAAGRVRLIIDSYDKRLKKADPSMPVKIIGFNDLSSIGEWLIVGTQQEVSRIENEGSALETAAANQAKDILQQFNNAVVAGKKQQKALNLILKTDTSGSKEALSGLIEKLARENKEINCSIRVIMSGIGDISEGDVKLAMNTSSYVIGLHVRVEKNAQLLAKDMHVSIYQYDIIYHIIEFLQGELYNRREIKMIWEKVAELVVRKVFDIKGLGVIAGCYVREGVVAKGNKVVCMRYGKAIGECKIASLQRDKKTVKEVHVGYECGFICDTYTDWQEDDVVQVLREVKAE